MSPRVRVAFAALFVLLVGTAAVSYWNVRNLIRAAGWVTYTQEALVQIADVLSAMQDAETGGRGYLITANPVYLEPYYNARSTIDERFKRLRSLAADSAEQRQLIAELEDLATIEFADLDRAIRVRADQGFSPAAEEVVRGTGKAAMNAIRTTIAEMQRNEKELLALRTRQTHQAAFLASTTFSVAALLAASLLLVLRRLLRNQLAERERTNSELERLNRAKDAFLATLSHELRSPLSPIVMWARMLRSGKLDAAQAERALEVIERSAMSQGRLVDDLLDVSRINAGTMRLDPQPLQLAPVIERAVEVVRPVAQAKRIVIQSVLHTDVPDVSGDADRLQQVVWNLLTNAVKFTPEGGHVEVSLRRAAPYAEIRVSDTGQGIEREFLPHVFDRFVQADSSSTRTHGGLGLGLAIVRHIVELHGGRIEAESAGEGLGSTFRVKLPVLQAPADATPNGDSASVARRTPAQPMLEGVRVLLVDDDPQCNEVARTLLTSHGAVVRTAASVAQGLEVLQGWAPDVLVSDIGMPGQDGYELLAKVRVLNRGGGPPAIAWTGFASEQDERRLLGAGFQAHIAKAADPEELLSAVARLAETSPTVQSRSAADT